jgi:hypothetical protein
MTTFHSRQSDCNLNTRKNETTGTFNFTSQIASSIYTVAFTKRKKSDAIIFKSRCSRWSLFYHFIGGHALPLNFVRILRLAQISPLAARSPTRWPRNVGKTSSEISRGNVAHFPGNSQTIANVMSPNFRQDDSQHGRATVTQRPMEHPARWLAGISSPAFNHDTHRL